MTKVYILRHGETAWNIEKIFRGRSEIPLTDNGIQQARLAGCFLRGKDIARIYTSPMSRASETAAVVGEVLGIEPEYEERFTAMDFGEWQGRPHKDIEKEHPEEYRLFKTRPHQLKIPGAETYDQIFARALDGLASIRGRHPDDAVLIVTHRMICKALLMGMLGKGPDSLWQVKLDTASLSTAAWDGAGWVLHKVNETHYLEDAVRVTEDF